MPATKSEAKGLIYEAFVALAIEKSSLGTFVLHPPLVSVPSEQDLAIMRKSKILAILGVTFWGSHEAAKMKFWRIHEDVFEVFCADSSIVSGHVLFERNPDSDESMCSLVRELCGGFSVDSSNCNAIAILQEYVASDAHIRQFGKGEQAVLEACRSLFSSDTRFRNAIESLSRAIETSFTVHRRDDSLLNVLRAAQRPISQNRSFQCTGSRETYFKPALLALLSVASVLDSVFHEYNTGGIQALARPGLLKDTGLISLRGIRQEVVLSLPLKQLLDMGGDWCKRQLAALGAALRDSSHPAHAMYEHYRDMIDGKLVADRVAKLTHANTAKQFRDLLVRRNEGESRCWPLDYFMAIQREHVPAGKFGFQRLSDELGVKYIGGISSLPRFAAGDLSALSDDKVRLLSQIMAGYSKKWKAAKTSAGVVQEDRRVTLMKKLPVLEIMVSHSIKESLPKAQISENVVAKHPMSDRVDNKNAGSTQFNFRIDANNKRSWIFIVSAYEATHKHKEVSGRLRAAYASAVVAPADLKLLLVDGLFFAANGYQKRCEILHSAGWDGAFYFDEMDELITAIG
jgi:hypothetical protein